MLYDYLRPRQQAIGTFGPNVVGVLDGERPPTAAERLHALLGSVSIGVHASLLDRTGGQLEFAENRADRIALALIAPPKAVITASDTSVRPFTRRVTSMTEQLVCTFGLPTAIAKAYCSALLTTIGKGPSWAESLR